MPIPDRQVGSAGWPRTSKATAGLEPFARQQTRPVPDYLRQNYWWAYMHPKGVRVFERQWLVNLILWGNFGQLRDSALDELGSTIHGRMAPHPSPSMQMMSLRRSRRKSFCTLSGKATGGSQGEAGSAIAAASCASRPSAFVRSIC